MAECRLNPRWELLGALEPIVHLDVHTYDLLCASLLAQHGGRAEESPEYAVMPAHAIWAPWRASQRVRCYGVVSIAAGNAQDKHSSFFLASAPAIVIMKLFL